ncbi:hypothetical protein V5O48_014531 [Marasmius crinis-equi]|uniref:Non-specific serine/threonine protein kinase n=1 Tax=Marasmius crinis-equi TaxID=585013 RepID=A0ABR3EX34_9AGAR
MMFSSIESVESVVAGSASIGPAEQANLKSTLEAVTFKRGRQGSDTPEKRLYKKRKSADSNEPKTPKTELVSFHMIQREDTILPNSTTTLQMLKEHTVAEVELLWGSSTTTRNFHRSEVTQAAAKRIQQDDLFGLGGWNDKKIRVAISIFKLTNKVGVKKRLKGKDINTLKNAKEISLCGYDNFDLSPDETSPYCLVVNVPKEKGKVKDTPQLAVRIVRSPEHVGRRILEFLYESHRLSFGYKMMHGPDNQLILISELPNEHVLLGQEAPADDPDVAKVRLELKENEHMQVVQPAKVLRDEELTDDNLAQFIRQESLAKSQVLFQGDGSSSSESPRLSPTQYGTHDPAATHSAHRPPTHRSRPGRHLAGQRTATPIYDGNNAPGHPLAIGLDPKLFHPIFARFVQLYEEGCEKMRCSIHTYGHRIADHTTPSDATIRGLVWQLSNALSNLDVSEAERLEEIIPILRDLLGLPTRKFNPMRLESGDAPDIASLTETLAPLIIAELKADLMAGSITLPRTQALFGYISYLQAFRKEKWNLDTCSPCFLITLVGNQLEISGVVCPSRVHVTSLLTLELGYSAFPTDDVNVIWKAQVAFHALKTCLTDLESYYEKVQKWVPVSAFRPTLVSIGDNDSIERHAAPRLFPWPTSFVIRNALGIEARVFFRYMWPLQMRATCTIFVVKIISSDDGLKNTDPSTQRAKPRDDPHPVWDNTYRNKNCADKVWFEASPLQVGQKVVIKYVRAYNNDCHSYMWKEHELSPKERAFLKSSSNPLKLRFVPELYGIADYECAGGFLAGYGKMVVMEYLEGWQTLSSTHTKNQALGVIPRVLLAVERLNALYVHGDLRAPNIMVEPAAVEPRVYIVDYDIAGALHGKFTPMLPARWDHRCKRRMNMSKSQWALTVEQDQEMLWDTFERLGFCLS